MKTTVILLVTVVLATIPGIWFFASNPLYKHGHRHYDFVACQISIDNSGLIKLDGKTFEEAIIPAGSIIHCEHPIIIDATGWDKPDRSVVQ